MRNPTTRTAPTTRSDVDFANLASSMMQVAEELATLSVPPQP